MMDQLEKDFAVHEAVCAQRYANIEAKLDAGKERMRGIEIKLYIVIVAILFGPGVAADIIKKLVGL